MHDNGRKGLKSIICLYHNLGKEFQIKSLQIPIKDWNKDTTVGHCDGEVSCPVNVSGKWSMASSIATAVIRLCFFISCHNPLILNYCVIFWQWRYIPYQKQQKGVSLVLAGIGGGWTFWAFIRLNKFHQVLSKVQQVKLLNAL